MAKTTRPDENSAPPTSRTALEARIAELERENAELKRSLGHADGQDASPSILCADENRSRFEQEIIESRNIVRSLIDSSDDYFALVDENLCILACNLAWSRANAIHPRQLVGHNILALIPAAVRDTVKSTLQACIREDAPKSFMISVDDRTFDCRVNPIDGGPALPRVFTCSAHDITRLMQAEKLQQEMELRYKTVFDSAGDAIFIHDLQGSFLDANLVFRELLGYNLQQIRQFRLQDLVSRSQNKPDMLGDPETMLTFQVDLCRHDGTSLPLDVSARRITFDNRPALLCIGRDITQRRRVESMLLKAKETAETSVRMQNEFVANISHELRTPLSSIIGITELLTRTELDEAQRRDIDRVAYSARLLLGLINDLLDLSRLESDRFSMASEPFSLLELMREIKNIFLEKVAAKNLNFSYTIDQDVPEYLRGDAMRLKQVLINIVGNAIKFTPTGSIRVRVASADSPDANAGSSSRKISSASETLVPIRFEVADTGIGMSESDLRRIFKRFGQGANTDGKSYGGAGLGLSISRQLIRLMGGDIEAESAPGRGSTFRFAISLPEAPEPEPAEETDQEAELAATAPLRVLLVEDNEINREMIQAMIALDGHEVRTAIDGLDALAALETFTPHVIFMDLKMPNCDGYEATRRIREIPDPVLANTPIIALSAHAQKSADDEWRTMGMDGYLAKPIQLDAMRKALASLAVGSCLPGRCETPPNPVQDEPPVLNLEILRVNMGHNDQLVRLACEKFLSHSDQYIADLESAASLRNRKDVQRLAHSFKSVTGTMGAEQARLESLALEQGAPTEEWTELEDRIARLGELVRGVYTLVAEAPEMTAEKATGSDQMP
ncbi:hypothetical protein DPQ33_03790 [Oceanidesulfovibrio indonesiensis]|uniref:histidine kinase n=1 Tax=Oceanidesulfovibrio indonesiensis TaxID=54767 RepID=A0A7M3MIU9_9BACT|nr:ATP-binding protein [Oceanidesulfovibrio indonesiensis]TVM19489.1 hypothetical protein DPQ33_03790 [Oceanidesulfovibrio indonesiensis]